MCWCAISVQILMAHHIHGAPLVIFFSKLLMAHRWSGAPLLVELVMAHHSHGAPLVTWPPLPPNAPPSRGPPFQFKKIKNDGNVKKIKENKFPM